MLLGNRHAAIFRQDGVEEAQRKLTDDLVDRPAIHAGGVPAYGQRLSPARRALVEECVVANVSGQHGQPGTLNQRSVALRIRARRRNDIAVPDHDLDGNVYRTQAALCKSASESGRDCEYGFDASILVGSAGTAKRFAHDRVAVAKQSEPGWRLGKFVLRLACKVTLRGSAEFVERALTEPTASGGDHGIAPRVRTPPHRFDDRLSD